MQRRSASDGEPPRDPGYYAVFGSGASRPSGYDGGAFVGPFPDAAAASRVAQRYAEHAPMQRLGTTLQQERTVRRIAI